MLQKDFKGSNYTTGMQNIATIFEMNLLATIVCKTKIRSRKNKWHVSQLKSHANDKRGETESWLWGDLCIASTGKTTTQQSFKKSRVTQRNSDLRLSVAMFQDRKLMQFCNKNKKIIICQKLYQRSSESYLVLQ